MCGVPIDRADDYLQRLIGLGHRVAVCEQMEDPAEAKKRGAKSVVRRDVVRLVTPGTHDRGAAARSGPPQFLPRPRPPTHFGDGVALWACRGRYLHRPLRPQRDRWTGAAAEIARFEPREILLPDSIQDDADLAAFWRETRASITPLPRDGLDAASAERRLKEYFASRPSIPSGPSTVRRSRPRVRPLFYIEKTQIGSRPVLNPPSRSESGSALAIDAATRANLELTRTLSGERAGSLLAAIDCTVTPGRRAPVGGTSGRPAHRCGCHPRPARFRSLPGRERRSSREHPALPQACT